MNNLTFVISVTQYLKINPDECMHDDYCQFCTRIDIDYVDASNNICIRFGYEDASCFYNFFAKSKRIKKLLKGEIILAENIIHDLGFEWNQYYEGKIKDTDVLENYHFVSNSHKHVHPFYNSWLYNDDSGNIILEITPFYPWHNITKKTCPEKIPYGQWIKNYKPVVKTIIPKENLKQWIVQADAFGEKYKVKF